MRKCMATAGRSGRVLSKYVVEVCVGEAYAARARAGTACSQRDCSCESRAWATINWLSDS